MNNVSPIKDNVLLQAFEWPDMTKSGLYLPDMVKYSTTKGGRDPWRGKVLAVGPKAEQLKVGEIVRYQPDNYLRCTVSRDGVRYLIIPELLIYAVEDENEKLVRALKNRIVFEADVLEEKYGHIYLPQRREEPLLYGKIVVAGKGSGVHPGDRVVMENKSTWQYFDSAGKRYILTDRFNLLAKVS